MRIGKIIVFSLVLGIVLTMVSLVRYEHEAVPDLDMFRYGFPLLWLFHQTTSITGPVDIWSVEWPILVVNFIFWWIISIAIVFVWRKLRA